MGGKRSREPLTVRQPLRVGYFGYRGWAFRILDNLLSTQAVAPKHLVIGTVPYNQELINYGAYRHLKVLDPRDQRALVRLVQAAHIDLALFYGWSWIVPNELTTALDCLCLHPSLLPRYRGGNPLQHQILNDEREGGLTIFRMNDALDGGDILAQRSFSLNGTLAHIFSRIVKHGTAATRQIIRAYGRGSVVMRPQRNLTASRPWRRRTPAESELTLAQLRTLPARYFYNFVRALDDPYPNCFIVLPRGERLLIKEVRLLSSRPPRGIPFAGTRESVTDRTYVVLKDGFAALVRSLIEPGVAVHSKQHGQT